MLAARGTSSPLAGLSLTALKEWTSSSGINPSQVMSAGVSVKATAYGFLAGVSIFGVEEPVGIAE